MVSSFVFNISPRQSYMGAKEYMSRKLLPPWQARETGTARWLGIVKVVGRERLKIVTGTCDTEGRISVIIEHKMGIAAGENERNGAKEATGSMALHSLCARRRGLRHHSRRRRRVATQLGDLWRNATSPFPPRAAFSRASSRRGSRKVVDEFYAGLLLTSEHPVQRACDLSRRRAWKASGGRRYLRDARKIDLYHCETCEFRNYKFWRVSLELRV